MRNYLILYGKKRKTNVKGCDFNGDFTLPSSFYPHVSFISFIKNGNELENCVTVLLGHRHHTIW